MRAGFYHSCGRRPDRQLECWGWNYDIDFIRTRVEGGEPVLHGDELFSDRYQAHMCPFESLGLLYLLQDRPEEAKEHLSSALEVQSYWEYGKQIALAEILMQEGDLDKAAELLEQAQEAYAPQAAEDPAGADHAAVLLAQIRARQSEAPSPR